MPAATSRARQFSSTAAYPSARCGRCRSHKLRGTSRQANRLARLGDRATLEVWHGERLALRFARAEFRGGIVASELLGLGIELQPWAESDVAVAAVDVDSVRAEMAGHAVKRDAQK